VLLDEDDRTTSPQGRAAGAPERRFAGDRRRPERHGPRLPGGAVGDRPGRGRVAATGAADDDCRSVSATAESTAAAAARLGGDVVTTVVPDVGHHVGIGQPVALIAVLRLLLGRWTAGDGRSRQ
jgi:hypothetical protein